MKNIFKRFTRSTNSWDWVNVGAVLEAVAAHLGQTEMPNNLNPSGGTAKRPDGAVVEVILQTLTAQIEKAAPRPESIDTLIPPFLSKKLAELGQRYFQGLASRRHTPDKEAKELVQQEWLKKPRQFPTAAEAAEYFADWLVAQKGLRRYKPRTVQSWLSESAKEKDIRWR
ncbi:MAG: hypothetical protein FWG52_05095 [Proteobacteria bacterium]|nr:hypothetical protein [Pseudomonadota bacterium]